MSRRLAPRRLLVAGTAAALAVPLAFATVDASADPSTSPLGLSCAAQTSSDGVAYTLCSGEVPSFDGTGLDVDLTLPAGRRGPHPTVPVMDGRGEKKHQGGATTQEGGGGGKSHL